MKKKIVVALLACAMISLTACNSDKAETEETTTTEESTTTAETPDSSSVDDSFYTSDLDLSVDGEPTIENPLIETDGVAVGDYKNINVVPCNMIGDVLRHVGFGRKVKED